jgi:hypothetical protein
MELQDLRPVDTLLEGVAVVVAIPQELKVPEVLEEEVLVGEVMTLELPELQTLVEVVEEQELAVYLQRLWEVMVVPELL